MNYYFIAIVEGETEVDCIHGLVERIWREMLKRIDLPIFLTPFRSKRDQVLAVNSSNLGDIVEKAFLKLQRRQGSDPESCSIVLILLDAEEDCPATLAPQMLTVARTARSDANVVCVMPKRSIENWIVAGAVSLAGINGLPQKLSHPVNVEDCSGVAWVNKQLRSAKQTRGYKKTQDAKIFFQSIDLIECRRNSPSFDKLCRELEKWTQ